MRDAHPRERAVGIDCYVSDADGVGGRIKSAPEDFRVRELERFDTRPVDADPGDYPYLVVRVSLRGWDTTQFAAELAGRMGASRERVDWAGTKDKEAVTTQLFSIRDATPADLPAVDGADLEVVGRAGRSLRFGDLLGNAFEVVVREPETTAAVDTVTDELAGFAELDAPTVAVPNFFGQQRFGSRRPVTHEVGLALARGDWADALMAYLGGPDEAEPETTRNARSFVAETRDWQAALERFPDRLGYERAMLHTLAERSGGDDPTTADYRAALESVPTNLQRLFVHAAQSYIFNRIVSERLARGLPLHRPVAGDVVCFADTDAEAPFPMPDADRTQRVSESRLRSVRRHCERGRAFVTAPLVGTGTELESGEPDAIAREVLDEVGIDPGDFALPGEFGSSGTRRPVLVQTDMTVERAPLTFAFALPKGSYATVLLREYLKVDPLAMA